MNEMIYKHDKEIKLLIGAFENRTLLKCDWTHVAHLTVGLFYCFSYPFGAAKNLLSDGICWLNDAHGTPNTESSGYHETLTVFWLKAIAAYLGENPHRQSLAALANGLPVAYGDARLPLNYYSSELLFSPRARFYYVEPDIGKFSIEPEISGFMAQPLY